MKTMKKICYVLMFLPLVITLICMPFLPDRIPTHFGINGTADAWGNKYSILLLPVISILMGYFMLVMAKLAGKQEKTGNNNEKLTMLILCITLCIFCGITGVQLATAFLEAEDLSTLPVDMNQVVFIMMGVLLVCLGNQMPKARMNDYIGLRTPWSVVNEAVWKKCQKFGGITMMASGAIMVVICLFSRGNSCFLWSMGVLLLQIPLDLIYSYQAAKQAKKQP